MLLSNLESVPGHTIRQQIDVVYGSTVRSKHVGRDLLAGLKNIVGGELTAYTELLEESRQEAMNRMIEKARSMGANAIVGIRFLPQILPKVLLNCLFMAQQSSLIRSCLNCLIHFHRRTNAWMD